jgi:penicillin amidase
MKKYIFRVCIPCVSLIILIYFLSRQVFSLPPIGKVLYPFTGLVQNENDPLSRGGGLRIQGMGLKNAVDVYFDDRKVPHLYAGSRDDLYFAQGYMTAFFRLWQMDFTTYASGGRLAEIFGPGLLEYDRDQRRMGLLEAAKTSLALIQKDTALIKVLTAYTKGVNAYIDHLKDKDIPIEYKLLNYKIEPWTNLKTILIEKQMANLLSGYEEDFTMTKLILVLGADKFNKYFPDFFGRVSPVVDEPNAKPSPMFTNIRKPGYLDSSFLVMNGSREESRYNPGLGSNSWVVSGRKTRSGFPILCNDPHLSLSLPAMWLEIQLFAPGINVYGVSIPGVPAIIIGFNQNIAWGLTNGGEDVKDWYKIKLNEDRRKYLFDGKWQDLKCRTEEFKIKGKQPFYDTVYSTIQGPIINDKSFPGERQEYRYHALRWGLHEPSEELLTFVELNRAKNYSDYKQAIAHFSSPIQNFTFAGKDDTIAVYHQGYMPVKWAGQGKFVLDGSSVSDFYTRRIPFDSLPHLVNPSVNYVMSANQHPTNVSYPYYYNGKFIESRANRIKEILEREDKFDVQDMEKMQMDNYSCFAEDVLPVLLKNVAKNPGREKYKDEIELLRSWDFVYSSETEKAFLFNLWWKYVKYLTWDEFGRAPLNCRPPEDYVLLDLIRNEPNNEYFDVKGTPGTETADDIIWRAFVKAAKECDSLKEKESIRWNDRHKVSFNHLLKINAFSKKDIPSGGYSDAINAISSSWGPSWRMIVQLGPRPYALGIYPGGQSGNAGSRYYDEFVGDWAKGRYYELKFFLSEKEAREGTQLQWILK